MQRGFSGSSGPTARQSVEYSAKNFFTYQVVITALAPSASSTSSFTIDGDSDFFWSKMTAWAMVDDDGTDSGSIEVPAVTVLITNTTSGRNYSNAPVPLYSIAGNAGLPFILPIETFYAAKSTISIQFQNVSDNKTYSDVYLSFHGIKAFL